MRPIGNTLSNETKPLRYLLALTFPFLFSGSVFGQETEVKKEYWDNGKLKSEEHYKDGKKMDFGLNGMKMGRKHSNELSKMETNS